MRSRQIAAFAAVLFILLSVTASCGKSSMDLALLQAQYTGPFTAEYTVKTHAGFCTEYQLSASGQNGTTEVRIRKPDSVAGIYAVLNDNQPQMGLEELTVDALLPERTGYAPIDVLHEIVRDLKSRKPDTVCIEGNTRILEYLTEFPDGVESVKRVCLQKDSLLLQSAELFLDGGLILSLQINGPIQFHTAE